MKTLIAVCLLLLALLSVRPAEARLWVINKDGSGDAPTIQAGIDSAAVGDSVILEGGVWHARDISMKAGIYFAGISGKADCVTIDADGLGRCISCVGLSIPTTIKGFIFREGVAPVGAGGYYGGGAMYISESSVTVADCRFEVSHADNGGGAVFAEYSSLTFHRCTFYSNSGGSAGGAVLSRFGDATVTDCAFLENSAEIGGAIWSGHTCMGGWSTLSLSGCLFLRNVAAFYGSGGAVNTSSNTTVTTCTFAQNSGGYGTAIYWASGAECSGSLHITNSIIAQNTICCDTYYNTIVVTCCDLWQSAGGCFIDCVSQFIGTAGNFSLDPQFCDTASDNYALKQCSPCAPGNHPDGWDCGLIGAFPVGCQGTAVEPTAWGRIKAMFR